MKTKAEKLLPKYDDVAVKKYKDNLQVNIRKERDSHGWTQEKLGSIININGKQISNYEHGVTTPPIDILFRLCNAFHCELGYLLGDPNYSSGTTFKTAISNSTGLNSTAIDAFEKVIAPYPNSSVNFGSDYERIRNLLNELLTSAYFPKFIEILIDLDKASKQNEIIWNKLVDKYGKETIETAWEIYRKDDFDCMHIDIELSKELEEAICAISKAEDEMCTNNTDYVPLERYRLNKAFEAMIDELYPDSKIVIRPNRIIKMKNDNNNPK